ncbi:MAG: carboxypeptidase-like regulatory domain-containing protein, partial [Burkholderiaceae bacterium]
LDANDDGRFDAGESGAANVTVLLDGRFSARTDAQGRFEFPAVVAGRHHVTVLPDNLPLPWTTANETRDLDLPVRGSLHLELSARRPR